MKEHLEDKEPGVKWILSCSMFTDEHTKTLSIRLFKRY